jgi:hypothetical protein
MHPHLYGKDDCHPETPSLSGHFVFTYGFCEVQMKYDEKEFTL